jgi:hypothetical protein
VKTKAIQHCIDSASSYGMDEAAHRELDALIARERRLREACEMAYKAIAAMPRSYGFAVDVLPKLEAAIADKDRP